MFKLFFFKCFSNFPLSRLTFTFNFCPLLLLTTNYCDIYKPITACTFGADFNKLYCIVPLPFSSTLYGPVHQTHINATPPKSSQVHPQAERPVPHKPNILPPNHVNPFSKHVPTYFMATRRQYPPRLNPSPIIIREVLYFWCTGAALFHQADHRQVERCTLTVVASFRFAVQT